MGPPLNSTLSRIGEGGREGGRGVCAKREEEEEEAEPRKRAPREGGTGKDERRGEERLLFLLRSGHTERKRGGRLGTGARRFVLRRRVRRRRARLVALGGGRQADRPTEGGTETSSSSK